MATLAAAAALSLPGHLASPVSPLMLADQLLRLAQDADRSGMRRPAQRLLRLAYAVYDEKPANA